VLKTLIFCYDSSTATDSGFNLKETS